MTLMLNQNFWDNMTKLHASYERGDIGGIELRDRIRNLGRKYGLSAEDLVIRGILDKPTEDTGSPKGPKPGSLKGAKR